MVKDNLWTAQAGSQHCRTLNLCTFSVHGAAGTLPEAWVEQLPRLFFVDLDHNHLSGDTMATLCEHWTMTALDLSCRKLLANGLPK